jgi:hypothetical protein
MTEMTNETVDVEVGPADYFLKTIESTNTVLIPDLTTKILSETIENDTPLWKRIYIKSTKYKDEPPIRFLLQNKKEVTINNLGDQRIATKGFTFNNQEFIECHDKSLRKTKLQWLLEIQLKKCLWKLYVKTLKASAAKNFPIKLFSKPCIISTKEDMEETENKDILITIKVKLGMFVFLDYKTSEDKGDTK